MYQNYNIARQEKGRKTLLEHLYLHFTMPQIPSAILHTFGRNTYNLRFIPSMLFLLGTFSGR